MAGWHAVNFVKSNSERSFTDNKCVKQGNQSIISKHAPVQTSWFVLQLRECDGYPSLLDASYFLYWLSEPNRQQRKSEQSQPSYDFAVLVVLLWLGSNLAILSLAQHFLKSIFLRESLVQDATFFYSVHNSTAQNSSLTWLWNKIMHKLTDSF